MKSRTLILLFALLGLGASAMSSYVHYQLLTDRSYSSFCDVNATFSCTENYLSAYGSLFGVPVALAGVFYFALVLVIAGLAGTRPVKRNESAPGYIFALSVVGLAVVFYLGYASFFVLHTVCMLCVTTYVSVIAIFILSSAATSVPLASLPGRLASDLRSPAALVTAALFVIGGVSLIAAFPSHQEPAAAAAQAPSVFEPLTPDQERQVTEWFDVQPKVDVPIPRDGAKVLIVKFNDFQCPPCRQTYEAYAGLLAKWEATGQVRFVMKHFPLEPECNAAVTSTVHPAACEAAAAWNMAREKNDGSSTRFEQWLFANQGPPILTSEQVREAARKVAGLTDFDARYEKELVAVKNDAGMGQLLGVGSTPTFFINGHKINGVDPRVFDALIALELKRAQ